jgi:small subunit ribosomal protein S6
LRDYEITIAIAPGEEIVKQAKETIKNYIESLNGKIKEENDIGIRTLGYEINDNEKGFFYNIQVEIDPQNVAELERELKLDENILKYLTLVMNK